MLLIAHICLETDVFDSTYKCLETDVTDVFDGTYTIRDRCF
jgi:hypothetical protein